MVRDSLVTNEAMTQKELEEDRYISPVVKFMRPDLSREEQIRITEALRPYFRALYGTYCRMDRDGLLDADIAP